MQCLYWCMEKSLLTFYQRNNTLSKDTAILPRKLDWMITDRAEDLKSIMSDNSTFIQFPPLGSSASLLSVFGDSKVNVQRTIRSIMQVVCCCAPLMIQYLPHPYLSRHANLMSGPSGYCPFNLMRSFHLLL